MVLVLEYGAKKYSIDNWKKGLHREEILESMNRHLIALFNREELDEKESKKDKDHSGLHHIGHIMCNCMMYYYHYMNESFSKKRDAPI